MEKANEKEEMLKIPKSFERSVDLVKGNIVLDETEEDELSISSSFKKQVETLTKE